MFAVTVPLTTAETEAPAACDIVPETTTVLITDTDPLTAAETVCVGASQTIAPVTAAWVVVATAVEAARATERVCVGASQTSIPVALAWVVVITGPDKDTVPVPTVTVPLTTAETDAPATCDSVPETTTVLDMLIVPVPTVTVPLTTAETEAPC
jgi:hypothetical protein